MRTIEIEEQRTERPFVPFRLCLSDGKGYGDQSHLWVRHPEMLIVSRTVLAVAVHKPRSRQPERVVLCDPVHVVRLEPLLNGRPKARQAAKR